VSNMQIQKHQQLSIVTSAALDFKSILAVSFRRRWLIAAIAVPIVLLAAYGTLSSTDIVTASARVLIESNNSDQLAFRSNREDITEIIATASQVGMSIPVAGIAAVALLDSMESLSQEDPNFSGEITQQDLTDALLGGVDCGPVGESRIMRIAFSDPNPKFCLMAVDALTEAFIDYSVEASKKTKALDYFDEQISNAHAEIDSLLGMRANILNLSHYSILETSAKTQSNYSGVLDLEYQRAKSRMVSLKSKLEGTQKAILENQDFVPVTDGPRYPLLIQRKIAVEEAKSKLADLRTKYTEDFALVQRQLSILATQRQALNDEQSNYIVDLEIQLKEADFAVESFSTAIQDREDFIRTFPDVQRQVDAINLKIDAKRDYLRSLQVRRGEYRLRADTDRRISNIIALDKPTIDMTVAGSKKALYLILASVFALALGFMTALFVDTQDHRLYNKRQVEQHLEIPVMSSISSSLEFKE